MTVIPTWHALALCRTEPGDWFADSPALVEQAKAVCGRCAVLSDCLEWALDTGEPEGVWGAQSASERLEPTFLVLADPGPTPHVPSRGCYVGGCDRPECREANAVYAADLRRRAAATAPSRLVDTGEQLAIGEAS